MLFKMQGHRVAEYVEDADDEITFHAEGQRMATPRWAGNTLLQGASLSGVLNAIRWPCSLPLPAEHSSTCCRRSRKPSAGGMDEG